MFYINQYDYPDIPYLTDMEHPESENATTGSVRTSGCGLCSAMMMVDILTTEKLDLIECRDMAYEVKANMEPGTDMKILGPVLADKFNLTMTTSNDIGDVIKAVQNGGCVIANPGGDEGDYIGVFTHGGHYIVVKEYHDDTGEFLILDPYMTNTKFQEEGRVGKVRIDGVFIYAKGELLTKECSNRDPGFYIFTRNQDNK